jgi:hypothetical protein
VTFLWCSHVETEAGKSKMRVGGSSGFGASKWEQGVGGMENVGAGGYGSAVAASMLCAVAGGGRRES